VITAFLHHRKALLLAMPLSVLIMAFPVVILLLKPVLGYS
jgi:hypothetical protein